MCFECLIKIVCLDCY